VRRYLQSKKVRIYLHSKKEEKQRKNLNQPKKRAERPIYKKEEGSKGISPKG
jgi:hypothetical protein